VWTFLLEWLGNRRPPREGVKPTVRLSASSSLSWASNSDNFYCVVMMMCQTAMTQNLPTRIKRGVST
jgi:hypothetical protein